jgi:hypothetical protein
MAGEPISTPAGQPKRPDYNNLLSTDVASATDVGFAAQLEQGAAARKDLQAASSQRFPLSSK